VLNLDLAPTLLDYAGVAVPPQMQGRSLRPLGRGRPPADWRQAIYYHYYEFPHGWHQVRPHYGIRTGRHKLIHFYGDLDVWELYDLAEDPSELSNLYGQPGYRAVQRDLHRQLDALQRELGDTVSGGRAAPESARAPR